jgi:hypothetical protein
MKHSTFNIHLSTLNRRRSSALSQDVLPLPRRRSGRGSGRGQSDSTEERGGSDQKAPPLPSPLLHLMEEREFRLGQLYGHCLEARFDDRPSEYSLNDGCWTLKVFLFHTRE